MQLHPVPPSAGDIDRVIYQSEAGAVGTFRCSVSHPLFRDSGPIRNHCVVFPRTAVTIHPRGAAPFQADATVATVYRPGQEYARRPVDAAGDRCDYFVPGPDVLRDAEPLFAERRVGTPGSLYFRQRAVVRRVLEARPEASLAVDEAIVEVIGAAADTVVRPRRRTGDSSARHREWVAHAQFLLARNPGADLTLTVIALRVGCSAFHLCRVFRARTGRSLHEYRMEFRLRASLDRLEQGDDITSVALALGFSSHSHFTSAFRRRFGRAPRDYRAVDAAAWHCGIVGAP